MTIGLLLLATALGLVGYNLLRDRKAGNESDARLAELQKAITKQTVSAQPENLRMFGDGQKAVPEMETLEIDAERYIGVLQIPDLELELPVMQDWNYENLTVATCRYSGSCYGGDLVICAHNYGKHFSPIRNIEPGTDIYFVTVNGEVWHYQVSARETLQPTEIDRMKDPAGDWELTLFTCNLGGRTRCAVRCIFAG